MTDSPLKKYKTIEEYQAFAQRFNDFTDLEEKVRFNRLLCRTDLFWLLWHGCGRKDIAKQWLLDRCKEVESSPNGHLDLWARNHYKAIDVRHLVPTPMGMIPHGQLKKGDFVFSPQGKAVKILATTEIFKDADCFEVEFDCGEKVIASGQHLWKVDLSSRKRINGTNKRIKTKETILDTYSLLNEVESSKQVLSRTFPRIKKASTIAMTDQPLVIDPYVLGAWLGDGTKESNQITCGHQDFENMLEIFKKTSHEISFKKMRNYVRFLIDPGIKGKRGTSRFREALREMLIFDSKRIPEIYQQSSFQQRLALLQGLMDTDGNCNKKHSQAIFCNTNKILAEDVLRLASSLGLKTSLKRRSALYRGQERVYYQVQFRATEELPCFRLRRKQEFAAAFSKGQTDYYKIVNVKKTESVPVSCIQVEGGMYLIGNHHIATHNSTILTFGKSLQDILASHGENPLPEWGREVTIGIFSATRPLAKGFLRQIKQEMETNELLKGLFPDILYDNPKQSVKWSEDDGIIVKRKSNPKEATVEAWGLIDGMPVGKHFFLMVYDDVVTDGNVTTPEMIQKTTEKWALSNNLGTSGGLIRYIGTRYHFNDTYQVILDRKIAKPRIYPCTEDGTAEGKPYLLTEEELANKRKTQGEYIFSCFVAGTKILMSDFSERNLETLNVGDEVLGYELNGSNGKRRRVIPSKVIATNKREVETVKFTFESGKSITGTRDHKFYTGRYGDDGHRIYGELGFKKNEIKGAISFYDKFDPIDEVYSKEIGWLAGMFDGEGSVTSASMTICQSNIHNPEVCKEIERVLTLLKFEFSIHERKDKGKEGARLYCLKGGRQMHIRFINLINPVRKYKIVKMLLKRANKFFGSKNRDKLVSIESCGVQTVYNIQTETGNYIANTFAVKNCQMLLNPVASSLQNFKFEWLKHYITWSRANTSNYYIIVDPANSKKKSSDYTVMMVIAAHEDMNFYIVDMIRDRLNLVERADKLFGLVKKYNPQMVGYEQYGMQADIEHIREKMSQINYHFPIKELGGRMAKTDRISKLLPDFQNGKIFLPRIMEKINYEGKAQNLVDIFIREEYLTFPTSQHDDMLDALARIKDEELNVVFPRATEYEEDDHARHFNDSTRDSVTGY